MSLLYDAIVTCRSNTFLDRGHIDNSDCIDGIFYLEFRKALESVPHKRWLCKPNEYKIKKSVIKWIGKFLEAMQQRVVLGNSASAWTNVTSSVPQGSAVCGRPCF